MSNKKYVLAQVNVAVMRAPLDSPVMQGFVSRLAEINALADTARGFIWRLQTADGDATALRVFDDERILINMSVWESADALYAYVYKSQHSEVFRRRKDWFDRMETPTVALWWIPAGHVPTPEEAREKLKLLESQGPSSEVFTFKQRFDPPA
jgi:heme-degrading monooxygenase HmoA